MKTLLKPGDIVRIRDDIQENIEYKMKLSTDKSDTWIKRYMAKPGETFIINEIKYGKYMRKDDMCGYTDEMFEPDLIDYLYDEIKSDEYMKKDDMCNYTDETIESDPTDFLYDKIINPDLTELLYKGY